MMLALCTALFWSVVPQESPEALQPLRYFLGTWTGQGKLENGVEYTDEQRFEWVHNQQFMKSEYSLRIDGKVVHTATSVLGYDHEKKKVFAFVFGRTGASGRTELVSAENGVLVFEGHASGPGIAVDDRVSFAKVDEETFRVTVEQKKDGKFTETGKYVYQRKK